MIRRLSLLLSVILSMSHAMAVDTGNMVTPRFRSLQVTVDGNELAPPVITLNSDDKVTIAFDELAEDRSYLRYSLVHCDASWQPSGLVESEYLDGFNQADVEDYSFSRSTTVHYVHYSVTLPNRHMTMTLSGNYMMRVYSEDDPEVNLLQARFSVSESKVRINGEASSRTDTGSDNGNQQLSFTVDASGVDVKNMLSDLKVVVSRNGRTDDVVMLESPQRINGRIAYYEHLRNLIFPGGNEYRRFENTSVDFPTMGVESIDYEYPYYHVTLFRDAPRVGEQYRYDSTQHGRFKVREYNSDDSNVEADYTITHFTLDMPELYDYDIYIDGDMTCRRFSPESMMRYDAESSSYRGALLLKQGAYNYQYLAVPKGGKRGVTSVIEGDCHPTVNEYLVSVYYREPGARYDRLLCSTVIYSGY